MSLLHDTLVSSLTNELGGALVSSLTNELGDALVSSLERVVVDLESLSMALRYFIEVLEFVVARRCRFHVT